MKKILWVGWVLVTISLASYYGYKLMISSDKSDFLIGEATHGHHQIELACETCHVDSFGGPEVLQDACTNCHAEELKLARDSHPMKKFTNPRNADLIEILDARQCISCHTEHQQERTHPMGLTLPEDYCVHCHLETLENRESHKDLAFDTCASAGCHNFHDNRALYEDFLLNNANQPWLSQITKLNAANHAHYKAERKQELAPAPELASDHPQIMASWSQSAHATAQIGCVDCHTSAANDDWIEKPGIESCQSCHENEVNGFTAGKHGMRLSAALSKPLSPMTPSLARLPFHADAMNKELSCNSCHDVHSVETQTAAVDSCLTCHADDHSMAFLDSPHGKLWQDELAGTGEEGSGVSCATCHMPRMQAKGFIDKEKGIREISVEHNQNATLRPNEKMIRPICMQCHSLEFSIDALADKALIKNNFNGKPAAHIESIDWVLQRVDE